MESHETGSGPSADALEATLRRVQGGDADAYAHVVEAISPRLVGFIVSRCPPQVDPEEIAHEALVEAYQRLASYQLGTSFLAWVQTIARHRLIDACRQLRRRERKVQHLIEEAVPAEQVGGDDLDGELHALRRCLAQLDEDLRKAIEAVYCQEKNMSETARHARRSVSQISRRLSKARELLRACIERQRGRGGSGNGY